MVFQKISLWGDMFKKGILLKDTDIENYYADVLLCT